MNNSLAIYENFDKTKDIAKALSSSDLVPDHFKGKPANVLIALEFAFRHDIAPFAAMQSLFVVHGKPGMAATMAISLARKNNVWKKLDYEVKGKDESLEVTAVATLHDDTQIRNTVTMKMAINGGWAKNPIYKTLPEQMLKYRSATFLIRAHFPEVLFGMHTTDELDDIQAAKNVTPAKPAQRIIDVEPTVETQPVTVEIEPSPEPSNIVPDGAFEDLKADTLDFINTRPETWFKTLGKLKGNIVSVIENEQTYPGMLSLQSLVESYEKKFQSMQEPYAPPKQ